MASTTPSTWEELNKLLLKKNTTEADCQNMLNGELNRKEPRRRFALRVHSRLNKLRGQRERREILEECRGTE